MAKTEKTVEEVVAKCKHEFGVLKLAGFSPHRDEHGNILHFISLFCEDCGDVMIKITKLELGKPEGEAPVEAKA